MGGDDLPELGMGDHRQPRRREPPAATKTSCSGRHSTSWVAVREKDLHGQDPVDLGDLVQVGRPPGEAVGW